MIQIFHPNVFPDEVIKEITENKKETMFDEISPLNSDSEDDRKPKVKPATL